MKVLMFGWEFPPHISGGLGTACYGLSRGLAYQDVDILFVVPKTFGDEDQQSVKLIGASQVPVKQRIYQFSPPGSSQPAENEYRGESRMTYFEVGSDLMPYLSPEEFEEHIRERVLHQDYLLTNKNKPDPSQSEAWTEIKETISTLDFSGKYGPNLLQEVSNYGLVAAEIARENQFDLIHAHDWLTYPAGIAAKKASGKPLVIHVHATEFDRTGEYYNDLVYGIEKAGMEAADRIIAVSNLTRNTVINRYGIDPGKVVTVYNAVEPVTDQKRPDLMKLPGEKVITFLGRVTYQKGPEYFMEAAHLVLKHTDHVRFVMAGSGDLLRKMIRRAARLGITEKFHFTDFLRGADVDQMFALSDVYVMPSVSEPFGISPLEAMRSHVPVIISKQSGVSEILKHAIKVDFWDIEAMADAIYGLIAYRGVSDMFSAYGIEEVENLKWEKAALRIKDQYERVISG